MSFFPIKKQLKITVLLAAITIIIVLRTIKTPTLIRIRCAEFFKTVR
jgi:hypothetical protein